MIRNSSRELLALGFFLLVFILAGAKDARIFDASSINSILLWLPILLVAAMGQLLVIVLRGIDISIGSTIGFTGIAVGLIYRSFPSLPTLLAFLIAIAIGLLLGAINGFLITIGKLSPVVVTIGTLTTFRGAAFLLSQGDQIDSSVIPDSLTNLAKYGLSIGDVTLPNLLLIALAVSAIFGLCLRFTQRGRDIYAIGSNPPAAHLRGIPVAKTTWLAYAICGGTAGLAGIMYASRFGFVNPGTAGQNLELTVIAAVAIGGVKFTGGYGKVGGVILGGLLLATINVALTVVGIDANWQILTQGALILVALTVDGVTRIAHQRRVLVKGAGQ